MSDSIPITWAIILTLAGAVILLHLWRCWSGRSRGWARSDSSRVLVLTFAPFTGLLLLGTGLSALLGEPAGTVAAAVLVPPAFLLLIPGLIYMLFGGRWWGPRWFRRLSPGELEPDLTDVQTALSVAFATRPGFSSRDAAAQQAAGFGERLTRWRANYIYDPDTLQRPHALTVRGGAGGTLTLYRGGLSFAGNKWEDRLRLVPTVLTIPAAEILEARVVPARAGADGVRRKGFLWRSLFPRLVVTTRDQHHVFETMFAKRAAARVAELSGNRRPA